MQNIEQPLLFIEETHIGNLFLQSRTWNVNVLRRALNELQPLMAGHAAAIEQEQALQEFFRVLRPGGVLLFADSTKRYIHSLFKHPAHPAKKRCSMPWLLNLRLLEDKTGIGAAKPKTIGHECLNGLFDRSLCNRKTIACLIKCLHIRTTRHKAIAHHQ